MIAIVRLFLKVKSSIAVTLLNDRQPIINISIQ